MSATTSTFIRVPASYARYDVDTTVTAGLLGLPDGEAGELATTHLPYVRDPGRGPLFDHADVVNLALFHSNTGCTVPDLALRFLLRFATAPQSTWYEPRWWLVRVCPPPALLDRARDGSAQLSIEPADLAAPGVVPLDAPDAAALRQARPTAKAILPPGYEVAVRITGAEATVHDGRARGLYQEMVDALAGGAVTYQSVNEGLRARHREAWQLGMADCVVASRLLADRLRDAGLTARARRGYLLGLVGSDHAWCELYEDDHWKPMDLAFAFLASGGSGTRRINATPEFVAACCGSRFNRLLPGQAPDALPLVHLDGEPAPPWLPVAVSAHPGEAR